MNIADFAARAGMSAYTLRYYEKIGLLPIIARDAGGRGTRSNFRSVIFISVLPLTWRAAN